MFKLQGFLQTIVAIITTTVTKVSYGDGRGQQTDKLLYLNTINSFSNWITNNQIESESRSVSP